jgi:hypothetical protein
MLPEKSGEIQDTENTSGLVLGTQFFLPERTVAPQQ